MSALFVTLKSVKCARMPGILVTVKMLFKDCKASPSTTLAQSVIVYRSKGAIVHDVGQKIVNCARIIQAFAVAKLANVSFSICTAKQVIISTYMNIG